MSEERKLTKVKINLMRDPRFALMSGILMVGKTGIKDGIPTACTNGRDEWYGREFVGKLTEKELGFVVAHEAMHKMYRHLTTWKKLHDEDSRLANAACDYVINLQLRDLDKAENIIAMPKYKDGPSQGAIMGLVDERFRGMNAKQVFDILKQEQEDSGGNGGDGDGEGFDDHDWEGAESLTDEEKQELERQVDQAIRQGLIAEKKFGKGAGGLGRDMEDLLTPAVDWREVLREFVKSTCAGKDKSSWRRPNRRFLGSGTYMPTLVSETVGNIVVAVDTSGSVGQAEFREFMSEVKSIADDVKPSRVDMLYWDGEVDKHEEYEQHEVANLIDATRPMGGGGTDPDCVPKYMASKNMHPECVVMFTDGYVPNWGNDWVAPVLWVVVDNKEATAETGKTVHIDTRD
jgi:predicted metal-dependent peptidase